MPKLNSTVQTLLCLIKQLPVNKVFLVLAFFHCSFSVDAQRIYESNFNNCNFIPSNYNLLGIKIIETADGNGSISLIAPGLFSPGYMPQYLLTRLDSTGASMWTKLLKVDSNEIQINNPNETLLISKYLWPTDIISNSSSGYYISSLQDSFVIAIDSIGNQTYFDSTCINITQVDSIGNVIRSKKIYPPIRSYPVKMILNDNYLYLIAKGEGWNTDSIFYLLKIDSLGNNVWTREFKNFSNAVTSVDFTLNNNAFYISAGTDGDIVLLKTDKAGNIIASNRFDSGYNDDLVSVIGTNNGCVLGINRSFSPHPLSILIDSTVNIINASSFSSDSAFNLSRFIPYGQDKFLMLQNLNISISGGRHLSTDFWIIDSNNNYQVHKNLENYSFSFPNTNSYGIVSLRKNDTGLLLIVEQYLHLNISSANVNCPTFMQLDSVANGCFYHPVISNINTVVNETVLSSPITVFNPVISMPARNETILSYDTLFTLNISCSGTVGVNNTTLNQIQLEVYPNPFEEKLSFTVKDNEFSEVMLYDIASRKIMQQQFRNTVSLNTDQLAKGIYIYEVRCGGGLCKKGKVVKD